MLATGYWLLTTLLRPLGDPSVYRLSLYVADLNTRQLFGAWGLDFSRPDRLQQGELNLDLKSRAAQGIVNGVEAPVDVGPQNVKHGDFESQVVWWRMAEQPINLALCHCARFSRQPGAQIEFKAVAKRAPLVIIPPP